MNLKFQLHNHGFEVHPRACPESLLRQFQDEFSPDASIDWEMLDHSTSVRNEVEQGFFESLARAVLGEGCFATHAILFTGNEQAQPWHQDRAVNILGRGFVESNAKTTFDHLLSVRLSLDDCTFFDGALKLCPSSHKHGPLSAQEIRGHSMRPFSCPEMKAGDMLLMHPLTIHSSAANTTGKPCRVIHVVYAAASLRSFLLPS